MSRRKQLERAEPKTDYLLEKMFEKERWETAIEKGYIKGIDESELRTICSPEFRILVYQRIKTGTYVIAPPHIARIPKDEKGEYREVYINENLDRLVLSIINDLLFESCADMIHPNCKSYQKGIGCGKVVQHMSQRICNTEGDTVGFKADLSKYFDSVPLPYIVEVFDMVEQKLGESAVISMLRKYYSSKLIFDADGILTERYTSLKQGCAVAAFLADVVLYDLDKQVSELDVEYCRYSDDILCIGKDYEKGMAILKSTLSTMGMQLNPKKVEYLTHDRWFKFLGFNIKGEMITLSKSRVKKFQKEIEHATIKRKGMTQKKAVNAVNRVLYKGNGQYSWATSVLPIINVKKDIDTLNGFVMDCIRACETGKAKLGGLGSVVDGEDYTILRGKGKNVKANREKIKEIEGYKSIACMQNAILTSRNAYDTLVRLM